MACLKVCPSYYDRMEPRKTNNPSHNGVFPYHFSQGGGEREQGDHF